MKTSLCKYLELKDFPFEIRFLNCILWVQSVYLEKCFKAKPKTLFFPAKVNLDLLIPVNIYGSNPWNFIRIGLPFPSLPCFFFLYSRKLQTFWPGEVTSGLVMPGLFFNLNYKERRDPGSTHSGVFGTRVKKNQDGTHEWVTKALPYVTRHRGGLQKF